MSGMATVWAYRVGVWANNSGAGWSNTVSMVGLSDLCDQLEKAKLTGAVSHLAIVAHGDSPGTVELDRVLTAATIPYLAAGLARLKTYLTTNAWLTFYSCGAGKAGLGTRLLVELPSQLPGRTIVGFKLFGLIGPPGSLNTPGAMTAVDTSLLQLAMR